MTDISVKRTLAEALRRLVGEVLSSVEFVADYVQLWFNGPCLTAYTPPTIAWGSESLSSEASGYRDGLCRQIGYRVDRTEVDDKQALVFFANGAVISISLRDEDYRGPEALEFCLDRKDRIWVV